MIDEEKKNTVIEKIRKEASVYARDNNKEAKDFSVLFSSFDLVNSTLFKGNHQEWPVVIHKFYELALREMREASSHFNIWKFVGDEVLFYKKIESFDELSADVKNVHDVLKRVASGLDATFPTAKNFLSVKGTTWIARVTDKPPSEMNDAVSAFVRDGRSDQSPVTNIMVQVPTDDDRQLMDFLGPDIDAGFRISKYSDKKKLVISANLAKLIMDNCPQKLIDINNFKVVSFEVLRGVWNGRPYPIVWYYDDWSRISETFYYDEINSGGIIKDVCDGKYSNISILEKIFSDLCKEREILSLCTAIKEYNRSEDVHVALPVRNKSKMSEVHCAAICFSEDGKILLAKRSEGKVLLPGVWEFGCGQMHLDQDFEDCIRDSYKEDFGIDIGFVSKIPISTYLISGPPKVPGLLFYAEAKGAADSSQLKSSKHAEVKWYEIDYIKEMPLESLVPDAANSIECALSQWNERRQKK